MIPSFHPLRALSSSFHPLYCLGFCGAIGGIGGFVFVGVLVVLVAGE